LRGPRWVALRRVSSSRHAQHNHEKKASNDGADDFENEITLDFDTRNLRKPDNDALALSAFLGRQSRKFASHFDKTFPVRIASPGLLPHHPC
jgi:hypothetical protein